MASFRSHGSRWAGLVACAACAGWFQPPSSALAQTQPQRPPLTAEHVVSHRLSAQWLSPQGRPLDITSTVTRAFIVDSVSSAGGLRTVHMRVFSATFDSAGHLVGYAPPNDPRIAQRDSTRGTLRSRLPMGLYFESHRPGAAYRMLPADLDAGQRWTEPATWRIDRWGLSEAETGTRTTVVAGDTVIEGRRHWILTDSVDVRRVETWSEPVYTIEGDASNRRESTGHRVGRSIWDPDRSLIVHAVDTTYLEGTIERTLPDGRQVAATQSAVYVAEHEVLSAAEHERRRDEQIDARRRASGGIVRVPHTPLENRLAAQDTMARDSLIAAWRDAGLEGRNEIERLLAWFRGRQWRVPLLSSSLQSGDTLQAFQQAIRIGFEALSDAQFGFVFDVLTDPAIALRWGMRADVGYSDLHSWLLRQQVNDAQGSPMCDGVTWCERLASYADRTDIDPRLADLGLGVTFLLEPVETYPRLQQRAITGTGIARSFVRLAQGHAFEYSAYPGTGPIPEPGADWRAWRGWIDQRGRVRTFPDTHVLRLYERRTGRSFDDVFRSGYETAESDSARLVFGMLLKSVDPDAFDVATVEDLLLSGSEPLTELARPLASALLAQAPLVPDTVAEELLRTVLAIMADSADASVLGIEGRPPFGRVDPETVLLTDSLPPTLASEWSARFETTTAAEWRGRDPRQGGEALTLHPIRAIGNLLAIVGTVSGRSPVAPDEGPRHWAGGFTVVLLRTADGWRYVSGSRWVT